MIIKRLLSSLALVLVLLAGTEARAGIPVIDAANLANSIQQVIAWGQQYAQMVQSLQHLQQQYAQLQTTYNSMTGSRSLSTLLNGPTDQAMRRYLPAQGTQIDQLAAGAVVGFGPLQSTIASLKSAVSSMPNGTFSSGSDALNVLSAKVNSLATQKALGQAAYSSAGQRTTDIENLIATSGLATDPKGIAEMQARISAQQALLQNESAKLQAMQYMQAVEQQQNDQRANEAISKWGKTTLPAVTF
jgi:type IV secretion system protein VirB5